MPSSEVSIDAACPALSGGCCGAVSVCAASAGYHCTFAAAQQSGDEIEVFAIVEASAAEIRFEAYEAEAYDAEAYDAEAYEALSSADQESYYSSLYVPRLVVESSVWEITQL